MPKIKPTTLFGKRTLPILLVDDSPRDSVLRASQLVQPLIDEMSKHLPKFDPAIVHVENTGNAVFNMHNLIDALLNVTQPTILVAAGIEAAAMHESWDRIAPELKRASAGAIAATAAPFQAYAKFLVAAGGGFILHVSDKNMADDMNAALPIIHFNCVTNSFKDIDYKINLLFHRMIAPENISHHMTVQSVTNNPWPKNKLQLCMGSWNRAFGDESTNQKLSYIVNVKGIAGTPITVEEFITKIWCNPHIDISDLTPARALIVRNPSIEGKLVLAKVLNEAQHVDAANLKNVEV